MNSQLRSVGGPPISPSSPTVARRPSASPIVAAGAPSHDTVPIVARRDSAVLTDLIALAERVLNGPALSHRIAEVEALGTEVTRAARRPTDARRTIGEAETMLIVAMRHLCDLALVRTRQRDRWVDVTRALLDIARDDLWTAMHQDTGVTA